MTRYALVDALLAELATARDLVRAPLDPRLLARAAELEAEHRLDK